VAGLGWPVALVRTGSKGLLFTGLIQEAEEWGTVPPRGDMAHFYYMAMSKETKNPLRAIALAVAAAGLTRTIAPIKLENLGGEICVLMSRGHHRAVDFNDAVAVSEFSEWQIGAPEHLWWCQSNPYHDAVRYSKSTEGADGSFPVTVSVEAGNEPSCILLCETRCGETRVSIVDDNSR